MLTPRCNQEKRSRVARENYANNGLFAPAKPGSSAAANRAQLVGNFVDRTLDDEAKAKQDACLEASQPLRAIMAGCKG